MTRRILIALLVAAALAITLGALFPGAGDARGSTSGVSDDSTALLEDLLTGLARGDTAAYAAGLEQRIGADPAASGLHALLGLAYQQLARETADPSYYSRAERAYDRAQQLDPSDPIAATGQASVAVIRHQFDHGAKLARRACRPRRSSSAADRRSRCP